MGLTRRWASLGYSPTITFGEDQTFAIHGLDVSEAVDDLRAIVANGGLISRIPTFTAPQTRQEGLSGALRVKLSSVGCSAPEQVVDDAAGAGDGLVVEAVVEFGG